MKPAVTLAVLALALAGLPAQATPGPPPDFTQDPFKESTADPFDEPSDATFDRAANATGSGDSAPPDGASDPDADAPPPKPAAKHDAPARTSGFEAPLLALGLLGAALAARRR